jgi:hypothetical protein
MNQRIIFKNDAGGVSVIIPNPDCGLTIEEIAAKDVPPKRVFIQTGTELLTQDEHDKDPEYFSRRGMSVGDEYPVGEVVEQPRPYKIVDAADIPTDRSQRALWDVDEADLTDGVGA